MTKKEEIIPVNPDLKTNIDRCQKARQELLTSQFEIAGTIIDWMEALYQHLSPSEASDVPVWSNPITIDLEVLSQALENNQYFKAENEMPAEIIKQLKERHNQLEVKVLMPVDDKDRVGQLVLDDKLLVVGDNPLFLGINQHLDDEELNDGEKTEIDHLSPRSDALIDVKGLDTKIIQTLFSFLPTSYDRIQTTGVLVEAIVTTIANQAAVDQQV